MRTNPDDIDVKKEAERRQSMHSSLNPATRYKGFCKDVNDVNIIGISGEKAFGLEFGLKVDIEDKVEGDCGADFIVNGKTIDVKTARKPFYLIVLASKIDRCADVLVLAHFKGIDNIQLLGWATKEEMQSAPVRNFGYGDNHYIPATSLKTMDKLKSYLEM